MAYIDRNKFLKKCAKTFGNPSLTLKAIEGCADKCTADVVEVVRCRDCNRSRPMMFDGFYYCRRHRAVRREDGYCSFGKHKPPEKE